MNRNYNYLVGIEKYAYTFKKRLAASFPTTNAPPSLVSSSCAFFALLSSILWVGALYMVCKQNNKNSRGSYTLTPLTHTHTHDIRTTAKTCDARIGVGLQVASAAGKRRCAEGKLHGSHEPLHRPEAALGRSVLGSHGRMFRILYVFPVNR